MWLPKQNGGEVWSAKPNNSDIFMASQLIDHDRRDWDRQRIYNLFMKFEAEQICKILLARKTIEDIISWPWEKNHNYSVRSAYYLIQQKKKLQSLGLPVWLGLGDGFGN